MEPTYILRPGHDDRIVTIYSRWPKDPTFVRVQFKDGHTGVCRQSELKEVKS